MHIQHLSLKDFRNYPDAELLFGKGLNMLIGRNGQGKTNAVEAIMYFATLRSHRTSTDSAMIRAGTDVATMLARLQQNSREAILEMQLNRTGPNKAFINKHPARTRELTHLISAVLFAPEDLAIVRGEPAIRRRFLDDALMSRHPVAAGAITDYDRVLRQRNTLLRDAKYSQKQSGVEQLLDVWDEQLVSLGSQIIAHRRLLVNDLQAPLVKGYFSLVGEDHEPSLVLDESIHRTLDVSRETINAATGHGDVSRETIAEDFRAALRMVRQRELERGQTLVGPHRDDVQLGLNSLPVKGFASHGETWSFVLALKLSLALVLRADSQTGDPILILDDVFAELDVGRRENLFAAIEGFEQVIVTAAVEGDVPQRGQWRVQKIRGGRVLDGVTDELGGLTDG